MKSIFLQNQNLLNKRNCLQNFFLCRVKSSTCQFSKIWLYLTILSRKHYYLRFNRSANLFFYTLQLTTLRNKILQKVCLAKFFRCVCMIFKG